MNQFLEVAVEEVSEQATTEALTYEDGIAVATADAELTSLEAQYNAFETVLALDPSLDESALEGYAFGLDAPVSVIQSLISLEEDSKFAKMKDALVKFFKGIIKWIKEVAKKTYDAMFNKAETLKEAVDDLELIDPVTEKEIDEVEKETEDDKKLKELRAKTKTDYVMSEYFLDSFIKSNDNGYYAKSHDKEGVLFVHTDDDEQTIFIPFKKNQDKKIENATKTISDATEYVTELDKKIAKDTEDGDKLAYDIKTPEDKVEVLAVASVIKAKIRNRNVIGQLVGRLVDRTNASISVQRLVKKELAEKTKKEDK